MFRDADGDVRRSADVAAEAREEVYEYACRVRDQRRLVAPGSRILSSFKCCSDAATSAPVPSRISDRPRLRAPAAWRPARTRRTYGWRSRSTWNELADSRIISSLPAAERAAEAPRRLPAPAASQPLRRAAPPRAKEARPCCSPRPAT